MFNKKYKDLCCHIYLLKSFQIKNTYYSDHNDILFYKNCYFYTLFCEETKINNKFNIKMCNKKMWKGFLFRYTK